MSITLDDLQRWALQRADMPLDTQRYEAGELKNYINHSLSELHDVLISAEGVDRFLDGYEFTTVAGQTRYDLPVNFYKSAGLDLKAPDGKYYTLLQYSHADRMLYQNSTRLFSGTTPRHRYRIIKGHLDILPAPASAYQCTLNYIPQVTELVNSSDTIDSAIIEGWAEYVEISTAIVLLEKDEELEKAAILKQAKSAIGQRIQVLAGRDLEVAEVVPDAGDTLFNLRVEARYKANMGAQGSNATGTVTDRELTTYINRSLEELYDKMVLAYDENYFLDGYEFTTVAGRRDYNLPTNNYKVAGVDIVIDSETYAMDTFTFAERNFYEDSSSISQWWGATTMRYLVQANSIRILPAPDGAHKCTLWFSRMPNRLTDDTDKVEDVVIRGWLEYVTTDAAIKMLNKAIILADAKQVGPIQAAIQVLLGQKATLSKRLDNMILTRNWGHPFKMVDEDTASRYRG